MAISRGLATTGDVQHVLYFRDILSNCLNAKRPNVDDVEVAIDREIDFINAQLLTVGYELPIVPADSPYGYQYVKQTNAVGAAVALERRWGESDHYDRLNEQYLSLINDVKDTTIILTDIPGAPTMEDLAKSGTSELTATGDEREPFFLRDQDF